MGNLVFNQEELKTPFNEISIPNPHVYGVRGVVDNIEDKRKV